MSVAYFESLAKRFYLPLGAVVEAHEVFEKYRALDDRPPQALPHQAESATTAPDAVKEPVAVVESQSASGAVSDGQDQGPAPGVVPAAQKESSESLTGEEVGIVAGAVTGQAPQQSQAPPVIGVKGLQALFVSMGLPKSSLEIVDIIEQLRDNTEELLVLRKKEEEERQHEADAGNDRTRKKARPPGDASTAPSKTSAKAVAAAAAAAAQQAKERLEAEEEQDTSPEIASEAFTAQADGLTFPHFLFMLQQRLSDEEDAPECKDAEVRELFRFMDKDGDSVLSHDDVRRCINALWEQEPQLLEDPDLYQLLCMHPTELNTALSECDLNADGQVTMDDLVAALRV